MYQGGNMTGQDIEEKRIALGWSKKVLAERLGVSEVTINRYTIKNTNVPEPVAKLMKMLAEKAGV